MLRSLLVCCSSLFVSGILCVPSQAVTVYDLATDYSTSDNTSTSVWSYRTGSAHNGSYALLDLPHGAGPGFGGAWSPGQTRLSIRDGTTARRRA